MFTQKPAEKLPVLDKIIDDLHKQMDVVPAESPEYSQMVDQLVKLKKLESETGRDKVSADVKVTVLANLLGILMIVGHERAHVVTSKALGFIMKLR